MLDADVTMCDANLTNVYISVGKIVLNNKASLVSRTQKLT